MVRGMNIIRIKKTLIIQRFIVIVFRVEFESKAIKAKSYDCRELEENV